MIYFIILFIEKKSTSISQLTRALAKVKAVKPLPNIQTVIYIFNFNNKN